EPGEGRARGGSGDDVDVPPSAAELCEGAGGGGFCDRGAGGVAQHAQERAGAAGGGGEPGEAGDTDVFGGEGGEEVTLFLVGQLGDALPEVLSAWGLVVLPAVAGAAIWFYVAIRRQRLNARATEGKCVACG